MSERINNLDGRVARLENCTEMIERGALAHKGTVTNTVQVDLKKLIVFFFFKYSTTYKKKKKKWKTGSK